MEKKRKLLITDDSITNRRILFKILSEDYEVISAENGKVALEVMQREQETISALILDLVMPVMDGYEVLAEMEKDEKLSKIPVIVTTQEEGEETEVKALSLGAADFLIKPYKPSIIKHRLANIIKLRETAAIINTVERDSLTGVYNKEFFYRKAEERMGSNPLQTYDLICSDIERFKLVNDLFGNAVGDQLLIYMGNIIRAYTEEEGICGRIGGDTFAMLIPHREHYKKEMFAQIIEKFKQFPIHLNLLIRFGIYMVDDHKLPVSIMCDRAKLAIASIKGKYDIYYACYDGSIREKLLNEQSITDCMKEALEEKQFQVYFQPKYNLMTEKIVGAEALVRWIHPEKGFLSPVEFIPLFEKNGFITNLDMYVWEVTCQKIRDWIDQGYETPAISVNVSRADIYNPKLPEIIMGLINKYRLAPHHLHLEITESAYTENPKQLIAVVSELKELGFSIEMDDFGTGYSSLNMLNELPINVLKLDMRFMQNQSAKNNSKNILSFIISLAKWLNLLVVAEGVETAEQVRMLRNMDCSYVQGYYYSKPLPQEAFQELLRQSAIPDMEKREKIGVEEETDMEEKAVVERNQVRDTVKPKMVIVDESSKSPSMLMEIFKDQYTVVILKDGVAALSYIETYREEIDIILLDVLMPVMDGFHLLDHLKNKVETKTIPVIIISQEGENTEERAISMGAADVIAKPFHKEVSMRRVENVMAKEKMKFLEEEKELVAAMLEMKRRAERDSLTGLYNAAELQQRMEYFLTKNETTKATFVLLNVEGLKIAKDTLGQLKVDEVLCDTARVLSSYFRHEDAITRMDGDEFAVFVIADISLVELKYRMEKLCEKLQVMLQGLGISSSIGVCQCPYAGMDYETLYQNASTALSAAKQLGKSRYQIFGNEREIE